MYKKISGLYIFKEQSVLKFTKIFKIKYQMYELES